MNEVLAIWEWGSLSHNLYGLKSWLIILLLSLAIKVALNSILLQSKLLLNPVPDVNRTIVICMCIYVSRPLLWYLLNSHRSAACFNLNDVYAIKN